NSPHFLLLLLALTFAHRARCAAAIFRRAAADSVRLGLAVATSVPKVLLAHRALGETLVSGCNYSGGRRALAQFRPGCSGQRRSGQPLGDAARHNRPAKRRPGNYHQHAAGAAYLGAGPWR